MSTNNSPIIGKRIPKLDAPDKATGRAVYGHDVKLPGMLHGKILYSSYASARVTHIDTSKAEKLPGVKAVLTSDDNPPTLFGFGKDNTPFKSQKIRSLRDEIAGVVATNEEIAKEALSLIEVEYEPFLPIFDSNIALEKGAPLIHSKYGSNLFRNYGYAHGNLQEGEEQSDVIVEASYQLPYVTHACMETSVVVASLDHRGHLTLWSTTQIPSLLQRDLSEALGIPGSQIRIIQTTIGGAFGRGLDIYPYEPIAAMMSNKTGKPVRVSFSRHEEFFASPARQPVDVTVRAGATKDGILTFRDVKAILDIGAYVSWGSVTPLVMMETTASLYRVPHVRFQADCVYTNNPITGAMRGYGNPQSTFFIETIMDQLAEKLKMDPIEFRIKNANLPNTETPQGLIITSCGMKECLEAVAAEADTRQAGYKLERTKSEATPLGKNEIPNLTPKESLKRGFGFASTLNVGGGARIYRSDGCGATVKVDDFGHVTLITGASEIGQGSETVLAQITAETLGVKLEDLTVINTDTDVKPWDVGVHASRTTFIAGNAAQIAALDARTQIFETASQILGVPPADLNASEGLIFSKKDTEKNIDLARVVRKRHFQEEGSMVIGKGWYDPPTQLVDKDTYKGNISAAYGFGAQMAEVEVDIDTGEVRVLRLACANDVGRAINPMAVEGQIEGGAQMGLGYALTEELIVKEGKVQNPNFLDYRLFTSADMPEIKSIIVETDDPGGPFGAKGVGEMGGTPTAAAIANAIFDAVGVRMTKLPMTAERVLKALDKKREQENHE